MFGLDTLFILGVWALSAGARAAAANNRNNNNQNNWREPSPTTYQTPSYSTTSSGASSSVHANTSYFEKKTIWDWWCNGLTGEERQVLLENGYSDRSGCFTLRELNDVLDGICFAKAPGKPTEKDGFRPKKRWDGKTVRAPDSKRRGYPDEDGNVWVPTGEGTGTHEPHWDVEKPDGGYDNVYPGGEIRPGKKN